MVLRKNLQPTRHPNMSNPVSRKILKIDRLHKWGIVLDGGKAKHYLQINATEARFAGYREGYWANYDSKGQLESVTPERVYFGRSTPPSTPPHPAEIQEPPGASSLGR